VVIFSAVGLCSVNTQIDADMLLIITSTSDMPYNGVNVNDIE